MTQIQEYVEMGVDENVLLEAIRKSVATKDLPLTERIYVGITAKHFMDGSDFGSVKPDKVKLIRPYVYNEKEKIVYFTEIDSDDKWHTGNRNVTLSPWDCERLLKNYE